MCIKIAPSARFFWRFGQISKKPPPSFWDLSNKGGLFTNNPTDMMVTLFRKFDNLLTKP